MKQIGGSPDKNITVANDENLWVHINNQKMWLLAVIETKSRKIVVILLNIELQLI